MQTQPNPLTASQIEARRIAKGHGSASNAFRVAHHLDLEHNVFFSLMSLSSLENGSAAKELEDGLAAMRTEVGRQIYRERLANVRAAEAAWKAELAAAAQPMREAA